MFFTDERNDLPLHEELLGDGVYTNSEYTGFNLPPEGRLLDALRNNAERVDISRWLLWLTKRHGYTRYASIQVDRFFLQEIEFTQEDANQALKRDIYPVGRFGSRVLFACCRNKNDDDWIHSIQQRANARSSVPLAITLSESISIRRELREFGTACN